MNEIIEVDGTALAVRPVQVDDAERLARMFERLSRQTIYFRFFAPIARLPQSALLHLVYVDHCHRDALVALDGDEIVAVARYDALREPGGSDAAAAEIAVTVEDAWQGRGVGRRLTLRLAALAIDRGIGTLVARILPDNRGALRLVRALAPDAIVKFAGGDYEARIPLPAQRASAVPRLDAAELDSSGGGTAIGEHGRRGNRTVASCAYTQYDRDLARTRGARDGNRLSRP